MDYQLESKLRDKVDQWQFHSQEEQIKNLKSEIVELTRKIGYNEARMSNQIYAIKQLVQLIIDNNIIPENENVLNEILSYSY